jgi:hypothetical protein
MMHKDHCQRCGGRVMQAGSNNYENLTTVSDNTASRSSIFVSSTTNARVPKKWNVAKIGDRNFCLQLSSCRSPSSPHLFSGCCSSGSIRCLHDKYSSVRSKPERHGRLTNNDGVNICETGSTVPCTVHHRRMRLLGDDLFLRKTLYVVYQVRYGISIRGRSVFLCRLLSSVSEVHMELVSWVWPLSGNRLFAIKISLAAIFLTGEHFLFKDRHTRWRKPNYRH